MEISLQKVLLNTISYFFHLSSLDNINHEPAQKYYRMVEEMLKLLKPVLDAALDGDASLSEQLQNAIKELGLSIDELTEIFKNWNPLRSRIDFVLEVESLISKTRASGIEILGLLKSSNHLPTQFNASSIELCVQKIKHMNLEQTSVILNKAVREQEEGSEPSAASLAKFADCFSLRSNQELLIEAVALEKLMDNAEQAENSGKVEYYEQLITLVTNMHERLFMMKQDQSCHPVSIPADFCCPLSLELMTDPVIVASGQTYERAFIRKWIDLGLTVCPKTRRSLSHTNLIPNYTVKALIANWCEINNVKLPDPIQSMSLNLPSYLALADSNPSTDSQRFPDSRSNHPMSPKLARPTQSSKLKSTSTSVIEQRGPSSSHPRSFSEGSLAAITQNGNGVDIKSLSVNTLADSGELTVESGTQSPKSPLRAEHLSQGHSQNASASSLGNTNNTPGLLAESNDVSSQVPSYNNDTPREQSSEPQAAFNSNVPRREAEFSPRVEMRSRSQSLWRRPTDRLVPRIVSSPTTQMRADLSEVENQVKNLVENLQSTSLDEQRNATAELRLLAKHNMDNRIVIAGCGAISFLVKLLLSTDPVIQENAVTALLNLSINDNNKVDIANVGAIEPLIHVLQTGSAEAKENSAATLFSLSVIEENKVRIGRSGAIKALVDLLGNGTPRGKKDASTALFNLSILHENKTRIVQAGAVKYLVELMDPAAGMVDKAVAVLANLATIQEGRTAIGQEGGIPVLVEVVELGSARGKENAAAALLQLCTSSSRYCSMVIHEGAVPPLVALSQSGTPRAKEKAQALLSYFRNQRHGNAGRS